MSLIVEGGTLRKLSTTATDHLSTPFFRVRDFGFLRLTTTEKSAAHYYPTPNDYNPPGWLTLEVLPNSSRGDFNGDGLQDLILLPFLFPLQARTTKVDPIFLIQNRTRGFDSPNEIIKASNFPDILGQGRVSVADFNRDGIDDAVSAPATRKFQDGSDAGESPAVYFGSTSKNLINWDNEHSGLSLFHSGPDWALGYKVGHDLASGDFNGDSFPDWFSSWYVFTNDGAGQFNASVLIPNADAALGIKPYESQWIWPYVNASVSADFDEDGFDDLVWSTMPRTPDSDINGGDLWMARGSATGLLGGAKSIQIPRSAIREGNAGTNFMVAADFNGDSHADILLLEHSWTSDTGSSEFYYSQGVLRMFLGNGRGQFTENPKGIVDPWANHRAGEGNIHVIDVNADGWKDVVLTGFGKLAIDRWGGGTSELTTILLNTKGLLQAVPERDLAWVNGYQFSGEEWTKPYNSNSVETMTPVDIGNDGLVDFVGFVGTPLHDWSQKEQVFTYGYVVEAKKPLGRPLANESLTGTLGEDQIRGYGGLDTLEGLLGNDTLIGGLGNDSLVGGGGADVFVFDTALARNIDRIADFNPAEGDRIRLDDSVFARFAGLQVAAANLVVAAGSAAKAQDADDHLILNTTTGALLYDADGSGKGKAVQFATLVGVSKLSAADFEVV